jgi:hypothetical protein
MAPPSYTGADDDGASRKINIKSPLRQITQDAFPSDSASAIDTQISNELGFPIQLKPALTSQTRGTIPKQ